MPRQKRKISGTYIHHVMARGNRRKTIFHDAQDKERLLEILLDKKKGNEYMLFSYCIMNNHFHLVIKEENNNISDIMKRINTSYASYYNNKYEEVGHVFQGRYKSEPVEKEEYLLGVIRYVHNNPVKAGVVRRLENYSWSSYNEYTSKIKRKGLVDIDFILSIYSEDINKAVKLFKEFNEKENDDTYIDDNSEEIEEEKTRNYIKKYLDRHNLDMESLIKDKKNMNLRNKLIRDLRQEYNLSINKLAEILGVNRNTVYRA